MTETLLPTVTVIAAVTGIEKTEDAEYKTYDSVHTGLWIERHPEFGWAVLKCGLPGGDQLQINLLESDVKRLIKALAKYL